MPQVYDETICYCGAKLIFYESEGIFAVTRGCGEPCSFIMDVYGPAAQKLAEIEQLKSQCEKNK